MYIYFHLFILYIKRLLNVFLYIWRPKLNIMRSKLYPMQSYFVQHYSLYIIISVMSVAALSLTFQVKIIFAYSECLVFPIKERNITHIIHIFHYVCISLLPCLEATVAFFVYQALLFKSQPPPFWKVSELPSPREEEASEERRRSNRAERLKQASQGHHSALLVLTTWANFSYMCWGRGGSWSQLQQCRQLLYRRRRMLSSRGFWWVNC